MRLQHTAQLDPNSISCAAQITPRHGRRVRRRRSSRRDMRGEDEGFRNAVAKTYGIVRSSNNLDHSLVNRPAKGEALTSHGATLAESRRDWRGSYCSAETLRRQGAYVYHRLSRRNACSIQRHAKGTPQTSPATNTVSTTPSDTVYELPHATTHASSVQPRLCGHEPITRAARSARVPSLET
ncbi:hypothetical protein CERZMDRAFT_88959 [Cercospora zeae-maydis SCOH1-5]|uniref:Uncharacterized protein n=1 Tax=Cercospora zeae-maydis SCOH1-5 TaxID=717836 RepID=A0A6A6EZG9_9PEZI|nr:hypothetical protein CERZMDRAFT_88959 [Cercospora zeae-maydis SCOH1-5]